MPEKSLLLSLLDLTYLKPDVSATMVSHICQQASSAMGNVAAVCLPVETVSQAYDELVNTPVRIGTVANFPSGRDSLTQVLNTIDEAFTRGADEIDVVIPYHYYLTNERAKAIQFMARCRDIVPADKVMKTILETGSLQQPQRIVQASEDMIALEVDFIKTSTGQLEPGVEPYSAALIASSIAAHKQNIGLKFAGGIRTFAQAHDYLQLTELILSSQWLTPSLFRIGSSRLIDELLVAN